MHVYSVRFRSVLLSRELFSEFNLVSFGERREHRATEPTRTNARTLACACDC